MVFNQKLVVCIKNNGKILREDGDKIYLPYGCEYSLLIKNLNNKRAIVNITLDGNNVCDGGIIVKANQSIDIERFVKDNDYGNRFRFIERTGSIEETRGIGVEDGIVRVEYQFEKEVIRNPIMFPMWEYKPDGNNQIYGPTEWNKGTEFNPEQFKPTVTSNNFLRSQSVGSTPDMVSTMSVNANLSASSATTSDVVTPQGMDEPESENGITVPGSISDQKFITVSGFPVEEETHVIVMKLLGQTADNQPVKRVQKSREKKVCVTCKKKNKPSANFCSHCSTNLAVI